MERTIKGQSMRPFLRPLDICISAGTPPSRIRPGDVVIYECPKSGDLAVHRILKVDCSKKLAVVKGDNIPYSFREEIPISCIKDKVTAIRRGERVFDLENIFSGCVSFILAKLSRFELTPLLFKRNLIDPVLLAIAKNPLYVSLRRPSYNSIYFSRFNDGRKRRVYAFVKDVKSAEAVLKFNENKVVSISTYVRHRDRNRFFVRRFIRKVRDIAREEYGPDNKIKFIPRH